MQKTELSPNENKSNKVFRGIFLVLYFIFFAPFVIVMSVPSGTIIVTLVTIVVAVLPFYLIYKDKKRLEVPEPERSKITRKKNFIALAVVAVIIIYSIYDLYHRGGSLGLLFH